MTDIPSIVLALAEKEGKTPLDWFVADDHVTIVYASGEKIRYANAYPVGAGLVPARNELPLTPPASKKLPACRPKK